MSIDQAKLAKGLESAYAPGELPFCHDAGYQLRYRDRWLCSFSEAEQQRCPAFKKQCQLAAGLAEPEPESRDTSVPSWVGAIAEVMFWTLMAALLAAIALAILRAIQGRRDTAKAAEERNSLEPSVPVATEAMVSGDTDVTRLLDKARRAAERGELSVAIDAAHAAAVQGLGATGQVEVNRDRTNGDYVRELRNDPPLQQQFKGLVKHVERAQFGGRTPTRAAFDEVFAQVQGLLRHLALLALFVLALVGCSAGNGVREPEDKAPHGLYALKRLLTEQGSKVHLRVAPLSKIDDGVGVVVVYRTELEDSARRRLLDWVYSGGTAVIVGHEPALEKEAELELRTQGCGPKAEREATREEPKLTLRVPGEESIRLEPKSDSAVTQQVDASCDGKPYVVTAYLDEGSLTFFPEPELLSNASLSVADNASFVVERLSAGEMVVELVGPWTGDGAESPLHGIKAAGLLPVVLQLLALLGLLAVRQGTSFGSRREHKALQRRAFADHVRALAANYARARAGGLASANYGLLLIEQLKERVCPGQKPSLFQLAAALARRARRPEGEVVQVLVEAKSAFDDRDEGAGIHPKIIRELEQLSLQAGGVR